MLMVVLEVFLHSIFSWAVRPKLAVALKATLFPGFVELA